MNEKLIGAIQTRQQTDGVTLSYIINPLITSDGQQRALRGKQKGADDRPRLDRCSLSSLPRGSESRKSGRLWTGIR